MWKNKRIEQLEKEVYDLQSRDMVDSDEALGWKNTITRMQQDLDSTKNKMFRLEARNETYEQKIKDYSEDLIKARERVAQLEARADEDQIKIEDKRKELMEAYKKAADFEAAMKSSNNTKGELNGLIQTLRDKIKTIEDRLQKEAKQNAQVRGTLDQVKLKNEDLKMEIAKLQKKLRESQQQYESQVP